MARSTKSNKQQAIQTTEGSTCLQTLSHTDQPYVGTTNADKSLENSSEDDSVIEADLVKRRKSNILDSVIVGITQWLRLHFVEANKTTFRSVKTGSHDQRTSSSSSSSSAPQAQSSRDQNRSRREKKTRERRHCRDVGDSDPEISDPDHHQAAGEEGETKCRRLACPYFKHDPRKYQEWPLCPRPGWLEVHRVKEHLYRRHRQAKYRCVRCWQPFDNEQDFVDHQRAQESCQLGEKGLIEGFDAEQERQLRSRKRKNGNDSTVVGRWRSIFMILFPYVLPDDIPSPFYENDTHQNNKMYVDDALDECQRFVLREFPRRLQETLAPELNRDFLVVEQSIRRQATEIARPILASLFQEFRQSLAGNSESGPAPISSASASQVVPGGEGGAQSSSLGLDANFDFGFDFDFSSLQTLEESLSLPVFEAVQIEDVVQKVHEHSSKSQHDSGYGSRSPDQGEGDSDPAN